MNNENPIKRDETVSISLLGQMSKERAALCDCGESATEDEQGVYSNGMLASMRAIVIPLETHDSNYEANKDGVRRKIDNSLTQRNNKLNRHLVQQIL